MTAALAFCLAVTRQGIRGGTTGSLREGAEVIELHRREASELIESAIWDALRARGEFHADDLLGCEIPADALNAIGARVGAMVTRGYMREIGRRKSTNPASHGRKSNLYEITPAGRAELRRRVGVGAGVPVGQPRAGGSAAPDSASTNPGVKPDVDTSREGGGGTVSSQDAVAPDDLQLSLVDAPQGAAGRPSHYDWDQAA